MVAAICDFESALAIMCWFVVVVWLSKSRLTWRELSRFSTVAQAKKQLFLGKFQVRGLTCLPHRRPSQRGVVHNSERVSVRDRPKTLRRRYGNRLRSRAARRP